MNNKPINVEWLGHLFQYESAQEAFLAINEIKENYKPNDVASNLALGEVRTAITLGETDIRVVGDEGCDRYTILIDGEPKEIGI